MLNLTVTWLFWAGKAARGNLLELLQFYWLKFPGRLAASGLAGTLASWGDRLVYPPGWAKNGNFDIGRPRFVVSGLLDLTD